MTPPLKKQRVCPLDTTSTAETETTGALTLMRATLPHGDVGRIVNQFIFPYHKDNVTAIIQYRQDLLAEAPTHPLLRYDWHYSRHGSHMFSINLVTKDGGTRRIGPLMLLARKHAPLLYVGL